MVLLLTYVCVYIYIYIYIYISMHGNMYAGDQRDRPRLEPRVPQPRPGELDAHLGSMSFFVSIVVSKFGCYYWCENGTNGTIGCYRLT